VLSTVADGKYNDLIGQRVEIDRVRKAPYERAACLPMDARVCERYLEDAGKRPVDFRGKQAAEPGTLGFVPVTGVQ
jgi:hypothetical protein